MSGGEEKTSQITMRDGEPKAAGKDADSTKTRAVAQTKGTRLVCTEGLVKGEEFPLGEGLFIIGRKEGLKLTLDDALVSRRHAEISFENGRYVIRDLGSRNGTKVNGRRVREKNLRQGNKIKIGRTEFTFVIGPEGVQAGMDIRHLLEKLRERPLIPALIMILMVLAVVAFIPQPPFSTEGTGAKSSRTGPETSLQQAKDELASGNFSVARELLYQILATRPDDKEALALVKKAEEEETNLQVLKESETFASQGNIQEAIEVLKKISQGSRVYGKAKENIAALRHTLTEPLMKEAKELLREKQWDQARKKLETVLEKDPDNTLAVELLDLLISWESPQTQPTPNSKGRREKKSRRQTNSTRLLNAPPSGGHPEIADALSLYGQGHLEEAISVWQKESKENGDRGVREKFVLATSVKKYLAQAEDEERKGQRDSAIQALTKALSFHEKISGGKGGLIGERIATLLAGDISSTGEERMTEEKFGDAFRSFSKALEVHPGDIKALEGMRRLEKKAEEIYRQAYVLEKVNSEEALEKYRQILAMLPAEHEYYSKAQEKISARRK